MQIHLLLDTSQNFTPTEVIHIMIWFVHLFQLNNKSSNSVEMNTFFIAPSNAERISIGISHMVLKLFVVTQAMKGTSQQKEIQGSASAWMSRMHLPCITNCGAHLGPTNHAGVGG